MRTRTTLLSVLALVAPAAVALAPPAVAAVPTCHGHAATIVGTSGNDTINGTGGRDVIVGRDGDDVIYGHGGNDVICGNAGADVLYGGYGNDRVYGGFDWIHQVSSGSSVLWGDTLRGGPGDDLLIGGYDTRAGTHTKPDRVGGRRRRDDLESGNAQRPVLDRLAVLEIGRAHV